MKQMRSIVTFVKCAGSGSITAAASELGISPQAASRQLLALEAWLGVKLLHRNSRKLSLTAEGAVFLERCRQSLASLDEGVRLLRQSVNDAAGTVRLAVTPFALTELLIAPLIAPFQARYPAIVLEVIAQNSPLDQVGQAVDVGVQAGAPPTGEVQMRRVAAMPLVLCASPDYLARHGVPRSAADFGAHRWVAIRNSADANRPFAFRFHRDGRVVSEHVPIVLAANDGATATRAVLDGVGIGQLTLLRAASHLRSGALVQLDLPHVAGDFGLYVFVSQRSRAPRRSQALADFLCERLAQHPELRVDSGQRAA
jgi:DNA-binding transcriptional LysR family regulator